MNHPTTILLVDDDAVFLRTAGRALERRGYSAVYAANGEEALGNESLAECDAAVIDLNMPGMSGLALLERLRESAPDLPVIVLTGYGSIDTAIDAIKLGAFHYLTKPCDISHLEIYLKKAVEQSGVQRENRRLRRAIQCAEASHGIVGQSAPIRRLLDLINRIKDADAPVLITGESGAGKELVARALHFQSKRREHPFVAINCATLKPELLENELFGHVSGAFTGATAYKEGLLSVADRGALFIDEIADMDPNVQASLLRVIETGEFRPLGATKVQTTSARILAAANRPLDEWVAAGRFREDLYYRLNVLVVHSPPLRERKEDIPLLVESFLQRSPGAAKGIRFSPEALQLLQRYPWPGNVRELFNICERCVLLTNAPIISADAVASILSMPSFSSAAPAIKTDQVCSPSTLDEAEKAHIQRTLEFAQGNVSNAAEILAIDRRTLQRKMARYGLRGE